MAWRQTTIHHIFRRPISRGIWNVGIVICGLVLLVSIVGSKLFVIEISSRLTMNVSCNHSIMTDELKYKRCDTYILSAVVLMVPNVVNFVRFSWTSLCNKHKEWPSTSKTIMVSSHFIA